MMIKCKMCGGDLNIQEGNPVGECEFCGSRQTIPQADDEKKTNLFNRANKLRMGADFDKAAAVYASITAEFPEEAEAYWGLCLCKYGIEYVDDPASGKKIPTCHRTQQESIMDDSDFDLACENADPAAMRLYREEAKEIDRLQQRILSIVADEPPYDVFICYKETDENGDRTEDSVLGQDIYDALTGKGLKVFFSRITLEDKLGKEYEPYIYAALHSSKVMLAIGTKFEYYNAAWVKNEWARFLDMMKAERSKTLIPCYKDLDAYDMPKEFKNLQGQDLAKLGWLQDLTRGVMKLCGKEEETAAAAAPVSETVIQTVGPTEDSLLQRAFEFLQGGNSEKAVEYAERVLDINPANGKAYLVKYLKSLRVQSPEELFTTSDSFIMRTYQRNEYYEKVYRLGDETLRNQLDGIETRRLAMEEQEREQLQDEFRYDPKAAEDLAPWMKAIDGLSFLHGLFGLSLGIVDANGKLYYLKGAKKRDGIRLSRSFCDNFNKALDLQEAAFAGITNAHRFYCYSSYLLTEDGMICCEHVQDAAYDNQFKSVFDPTIKLDYVSQSNIFSYVDPSGTLRYRILSDGGRKGEIPNVRRLLSDRMFTDNFGAFAMLTMSDGSCKVYEFPFKKEDPAAFPASREYRDLKNICQIRRNRTYIIALLDEQGKVSVEGDPNVIGKLGAENCLPADNWIHMAQIVKYGNDPMERFQGLRQDGRVMTGLGAMEASWRNIIQITAFGMNLYGIDKDGRVWQARNTLGTDLKWGTPGRSNELKLFTSIEQLNALKAKNRTIAEDVKGRLQKELSGLGLFAGKRKKELKEILDNI